MYIGEKETKWLFVILMTSQIFVGGINVFMGMSGILGAVCALMCSILVFVYFYIIDKIKKSQDIGFFDMIKKICDRKISAVAGAGLTVISMFNCSLRLKVFSVAATDIILPDSPVSFAVFLFAFAILAVSFFGLEALTRYALPAGVVITALAATTGIFNFESYRITNIYPLLGNGYISFKNLFGGISMFADIFYLYILSDYFRKKHAVKRIGLKAIGIAGLTITTLVLLYCLAVPYPASENFEYPFFRFSSLANTSVLFQRLDAIVYVVWLFSGFLSSGALALFTMMIFTKSFYVSDYRGIVHMVIFTVLSLSLSDKNFDSVTVIFASAVFIALFITSVIYRLKVLLRRNSDEA